MKQSPPSSPAEHSAQVTRQEKLSYGLYFAGQNFYYMLVASFLTLFFLNRGLSEATVAALLLIPKIWDAVNDPVFGVIMDKVRFRRGRFLPWLKISWILIPASTIFLFSLPASLPQNAKVVWAVLGYVLWDTSYTICDAPAFALSTTLSTDPDERTSVLAFGRLFATVASIIATLGIEALYQSVGWTSLTIGLSVLAMALMLPILLVGKERTTARSEKEPGLGELFRAMLRNRALLIFMLSYFLISSTMFVEILIPIFSEYVLGSTDAGTVLIGICMLPMIIVAAVLPKLTEKADKFHLYIGSILFFAAGSVIQYFFGFHNPVVLYVTMFLRAIGYGGYNILLYMFMPDIVEYGQFSTGERQEGICFSLQTFMTKMTAAIVSSLSLILLSMAGFASSQADPVTGIVSEAAAKGFWGVFTLVPVVGSVLGALVLLLCYKLRQPQVRIITRCNNGELSRSEAEQLLP